MLDSIRKNKKGILLMLLSSLCVCIGQLLWKQSYEYGISYLIIGFGLYGIGALLMIYAYKFGKVSVLQPMMSLNYVLSIIFATFILNESVSIFKVAGIFIIVMGVVLIVGGDNQ